MFNIPHQVGATSKIVKLRAITISTGLPYTAGAYNTSGISATYTRDGGTATTITLATATAGTYTSSGFVHAGKGVYELGAPTAALASGADGVIFAVDGISDVLFTVARVELSGANPRATTASADVVSISGDSTAADNLELAYDGTGYAGGTTKPQVNAVQIGSQTASASGTITFPNATLASTTNITAASGVTVSALGANVITAASIAADAGAEIADAVWDEAISGHSTAGTTGKAVTDILDDTGTTLDGKIDTISTNVSAVLTDTGTTLDAALAVVDANVDAIKAKTDSLTFTTAGIVDANVQQINDTTITGDGGSGTEFAV